MILREEQLDLHGGGIAGTTSAIAEYWLKELPTIFSPNIYSMSPNIPSKSHSRYSGSLQRVVHRNLTNGCSTLLHYSHRAMLGLADGLYSATGTLQSIEPNDIETVENSLDLHQYYANDRRQPANTAAGIQYGIHAVGSGLRSTVNNGMSPLLHVLAADDEARSSQTIPVSTSTATRNSILQPAASVVKAMGLTLQGVRNGLEGNTRKMDEEDRYRTSVSMYPVNR